MKYSWKGHRDRNRHEKNKKEWASSVGLCQKHKLQHPHNVKVSPWEQQTNLLAWHFGPWCCITIPSLVTEGSAAEEISFRWTVTGILNLFCDLDLDHNRAIKSFHKTIHLMMCHQKKKVYLRKDQHSEKILKSNILIILSLIVTLILNTTIQFLYKTLWLMMTEWFRKYHQDKHSLTFWTFAVTLTLNTVIPFYHNKLWHKTQ